MARRHCLTAFSLAVLLLVAAAEFLDLAGIELALDMAGRIQLQSANDFARMNMGRRLRWFGWYGASRGGEDGTEKAGLTQHGS